MKISKFRLASMLVLSLMFTMSVSAMAQISSDAKVTMVNRTVTYEGRDRYIGLAEYEIADFIFVGKRSQGNGIVPKGDGWIDSAVVKRVFSHLESNAIQSQIPKGTVFPVTVEVYYFRPDKKDSSFFRGSQKKWLGGFHSTFKSCVDAKGRTVLPIRGFWQIWTVKTSYGEYLQKIYNRFYLNKPVNVDEIIKIQSIKKTLALAMRKRNGLESGYEMIDLAEGGESNDGLVDLANTIIMMTRPREDVAKLFPSNTTFPVRIKTSYFRSKKKVSQKHLNQTKIGWFEGFMKEVTVIVDANGKNIIPQWKAKPAESFLIRELQSLYDENH